MPSLEVVLAFVEGCHGYTQEVGVAVSEELFSEQVWTARWTEAQKTARPPSSEFPDGVPYSTRTDAGGPANGRITEQLTTTDLASEHARATLDAVSVPGFFAVDDAICLTSWAQPVGSVICRTVDGALDSSRYQRIEDPTRGQLEQAIDTSARDPEVSAYLRQQLPEDVEHGTHDYKVSVSRILRGKPGDTIAPQILVEPQLWWVENTFNRQLLRAHRTGPAAADKEQSHLRDLAGRLVGALLDTDNDAGNYRFRFPSSLYVEVAVIDQDDQILLLSKDPRAGGGEAQSGRRWTCSMEQGVKVSDIVAGQVDITGVALGGLKRELGIDSTDVLGIEFSAIALQSRHLNCAVLGVARTCRSVSDIAADADAQRLDYFTAGRTATLQEATELIHNPSGAFARDKWHVTARMRMILALAQRGL
ncbi:hypothetical protein BOX37_22515 [Nocardia mangyaensis]|uniref:Uncharacterized protein n=2 Tax=Nocardia mangyaensis TaxID=2213200 RepID=A0A1J0VW49_9NOCA|nr:hypothetical protein BOX37_22515 [Nocardia mangyaensis]